MTVDYATVDQTATAGKDYVESRGQLTFEPYTTERLVTVPLIDDKQWERDASFAIKLVCALSASRVLPLGSGVAMTSSPWPLMHQLPTMAMP